LSVCKREYGIKIVSQLGTVKIKGGGFELPVRTVTVASSPSATQEAISRVKVTQTDSAWIVQWRIHRQTAVNCNGLVK
jgi:mannosyltransferase OCH1-like enzyme